MMPQKQGTLFDLGHPDMPPTVHVATDESIDARFERMLVEQPDIYPEFVRLAMDIRRNGTTRYSADSICHVIRWHRDAAGKGADGFKLNDHFTSRLARKAMAEHEALKGFFETRQTKAGA